MSMLALFPHPVTIAAGAAVSAKIKLGNRVPLALFMPAAWTTAAITFQVSRDDVTYVDLFDDGGNEVTIAEGAVTAGIGKAIALTGIAGALAVAEWIKIRSGVTATPVNQVAAASFYMTTREG